MSIVLKIEKEDLFALYKAYLTLRYNSFEVQDIQIQKDNQEQEKRIKALIEPLIK